MEWINDKYGWNHPLFNRSTITQISIQVADKDLVFLLDPRNKETKTGVVASVVIESAALGKLVLQNSTLKIQGGASRMYFSKSFKIKFGKKVFGVKGFSLKGKSFSL